MTINLALQLFIITAVIHYSLGICKEVPRCSSYQVGFCYNNIYILECTHLKSFTVITSNPSYLNVSQSNIQEIQPGSLRYLTRLNKLWMANNSIAILEPGSFNGLSSLSELSLTKNNIKAIYKGVFSGMYTLSLLDLSHNQIQTIDSNSFTGTDSLNTLYLNDNLISDMTILTENCKNLEVLDLSNNKLEELEFVKSCTMLHILNVSRNNLSRFSGSELISAITSLDLSDNNVSYIQRTDLKNLVNLIQLNLSRNPLFEKMEMHVDLFQDTTLLKVLNLSFTSIKTLRAGVFSQTLLLEVLDLNSNKLTYLPNFIFHHLKFLKELHLRDNRLSSFFYDGSTLNKLDLNGNLWNCDSLSNIIRKLGVKEILRGDSYNTTNIYGIACHEEVKDFEKVESYNSSGMDDLQKEYLSHLIKTQNDISETFAQLKTFLKQSTQNIPDLKDILNETTSHLQDLENLMIQQKFDEENLLSNLTDAFELFPKLAYVLTNLKSDADSKGFLEEKPDNITKQLITAIFEEENLLPNLKNALVSLPKVANELAVFNSQADFRGTLEANNDSTLKQLIMELKNIILSFNSYLLFTKTDTSGANSLQTLHSKADSSPPATNKSDSAAFYCMIAILLAILCLLLIKEYRKYKHSRRNRQENNPLNSLVV